MAKNDIARLSPCPLCRGFITFGLEKVPEYMNPRYIAQCDGLGKHYFSDLWFDDSGELIKFIEWRIDKMFMQEVEKEIKEIVNSYYQATGCRITEITIEWLVIQNVEGKGSKEIIGLKIKAGN